MDKLIVKDKEKTELFIALISYVLIMVVMILLLRNVKGDGIWELLLLSVSLLFLAPLLIIKKFFKKDIRKYFLNLKETKKKIKWTAIVVGAVVLVASIFMIKSGLRGGESVWKLSSTRFLLFINLFILPLIVFSQEFYFRGFLQETFRRKIGLKFAIVSQAILFVLFKLFTMGDLISWLRLLVLLAISLILGMIAHRFKSVMVSAMVHWAYLFLVDIYILYKISQLA